MYDLFVLLESIDRTHELLPAGSRGVRLVEIFLKPKSKYFWYDLTVRGGRFRGSTKERNETRAQKIAALKLAAAIKDATREHPVAEALAAQIRERCDAMRNRFRIGLT